MVCTRRECPTRRKFFKDVAGAAITGALIGLEATKRTAAGATRQEHTENDKHLVAVCGLYCGACPMYLATHSNDEQKQKALIEQFSSGPMKLSWEDIQCDGCLGNGRLATFCRDEAIRLCPTSKSSVARCSDCPDFPCPRITDFNNDGMLHHAEVLKNLRHIRKIGIKDWAKREKEHWGCPQCHAPIAWYDKECSSCGTERSKSLFKL